MKFEKILAAVLFCYSFITPGMAHAEKLVDDKLGFSAEVPADWQFHRSGRPPGPARFVYQYGLPKIWSDIERQEIENSVAITIYDAEFESLKALQEAENARMADVIITTKVVSESNNSILIERVSLMGGREYKTREQLLIHNKRGYVLSFTATHGTYDKNLPKFTEFTNSFNIVKKKDA